MFQDRDQLRHLEVTGNFTTDSGAAHYAAIVAGVGIGRVTRLRAMADLDHGKLVHILESHEVATTTSIYAVMPSNRNIIPAARAFIDFVSQIET
jgi:DNA-binding transcriptional LysR family regulator